MLVIKCRSEDVPKIMETIFTEPLLLYAGWLVALIVTPVAIVMIIFLQKIHQAEIARLTNERNELQAKLLSYVP